jgi:hypothetical protein
MGVLDTIARASAATKEVALCLDAELTAEHDRLQKAMQDALQSDSMAMTGYTEAVQGLEACRDKMAASEVTFTFERIPWVRRSELREEHPARDDHPGDQSMGFNVETYVPALIRESCVSVIDATGDKANAADIDDEAWDTLLGALNYAQVDRLYSAAAWVNDGAPTVPISALGLLPTQDEDESSKRPEPGESPLDDSLAGNPATSPDTTTTTPGDSLP